jgi:hypothetical protein
MTSIPRRAARRDVNEPQIVDVFERGGAAVERLSARGVPDLLVSFLGSLHLVEVKWENAPLSVDQQQWHEAWKRKGGRPPEIIRTEAHARKALRVWTMEYAKRLGAAAKADDDLDPLPETAGQVVE